MSWLKDRRDFAIYIVDSCHVDIASLDIAENVMLKDELSISFAIFSARHLKCCLCLCLAVIVLNSEQQD